MGLLLQEGLWTRYKGKVNNFLFLLVASPTKYYYNTGIRKEELYGIY